jgi:drug/metabolite transporter (DMT)-like permease
MLNAILYLISNFILTLYGLLIKYYQDIPLIDQVFARTIVFTIISFFSLNGMTNLKQLYNTTIQPITLLLSIVNFISIYGIYISFEQLGIGISQAIMYSWPIFYYLITIKQYSIKEIIVLIITFLCVLLILPGNSNTNNSNKSKNMIIGFIGIFASVITHIYVFHYMKKNTPDINEYLYSQYIYIFIGLIIYYIYQLFYHKYNISFKKLIPILLFNIFLGYLAFYLQFFSVKILNPFTLSLLTFLSIIFGVITDRLVFKQKINTKQLIGIVGIVILNYFFN